jgi:hypothetical protein
LLFPEENRNHVLLLPCWPCFSLPWEQIAKDNNKLPGPLSKKERELEAEEKEFERAKRYFFGTL